MPAYHQSFKVAKWPVLYKISGWPPFAIRVEVPCELFFPSSEEILQNL
jgi:hypothetical protein